MQTSSEFDCGPFEKAKNDGIIKGKFRCSGTVARPGTVAQGDPTSTGSGSESSPTGAAGQVQVHMAPVVGLVVGAMSWLFMTL